MARYECHRCDRTVKVTSGEIHPLSAADTRRCRKRGIDPSRMIRVECPRCGESSLTDKSEVRETKKPVASAPGRKGARRKKKKKSSENASRPVLITIAAGFGGVAVLGLILTVVFLMPGDSQDETDQAAAAVQEQCYGKSKCALVAEPKVFGGDPCPGKSKHLIAVVKCS